jgi:hypothetical protein
MFLTILWSAILDTNSASYKQLMNEAIEWANRQIESSHGQGRLLNSDEYQIARQVGVSNPDSIKLLDISLVSLPESSALNNLIRHSGLLGANTIGLTLGYMVYIREGFQTSRLLSHEFRHVFQFEQAGSFETYISQYLHQILSIGYALAPMEVDARYWENHRDSR